MAQEPSQNDVRHFNRLIQERSPYLLQHARNPVDWFPWGDEAFEKARQEDRPVFVSIGYSTCHWCHVMEKESFEDTEVARLMNEVFVSVKVDREERPDIDGVYMAACQAMTGGGGWPLTIVMTPDKRPFFAGTYVPRTSRFGRIGMLELVPRIGQLWRTQRRELLEVSDRLVASLQQVPDDSTGHELDESVLKNAYQQLAARFDRDHGGFGTAPKFPMPHNLRYLLRYWRRSGSVEAPALVEQTLRAMRSGGIYDQVGFGFHRYSTDAEWLVPHFEKMLYDQAMLAIVYIEAAQATGKDEYAQTAREILAYVQRDMSAPGGGFYSAEDADSEGEEGKFYVWTEDEIRRSLAQEEANLAVRLFDVSKEGNFADEATGRMAGSNILCLKRPVAEVASEMGMSCSQFMERAGEVRHKLFQARERRTHPHKDDKILTDWNGLVIAALSLAAQALDEPWYAQSASRAAGFILQNMRGPEGRLMHRYRDGEAAVKASLDDYAFLIWGLVELYEATFEVDHLRSALDLTGQLIDHFWDQENGGFYFTPDDGESLLLRRKESYDGAIPSGNSVAALNLLRLARMTANPHLEEKAFRTMRAFAGPIEQVPAAHAQLVSALDFAIGPTYEVVVVGRPGAEDTRQMLKALRQRFVPNKVVVLRPAGEALSDISGLAEVTRGRSSIDGKATAHVCVDYRCQLPTTDIEKMLALLNADL